MSDKNANLSLQVVPINATNSYDLVDAAIAEIKKSGIKHKVQPFSTVMEGDLAQLMKIVMAAKEATFSAGAEELLLNIQIHLRKDGSVSFEEKVGKFKG